MILFGREIASRLIGMIVGGLVLLALISFALYSCDKRRSERAQSKVDAAQSEAASESAKDAIGTVTKAGERETASEELSRQNEKAIREAEGAAERVKPGVDYEGRRALCRRAAYANDPKCQMFRKDAR